MALIFAGQNGLIYFIFIVKRKVTEEIQNMNPRENFLDPAHQPSNSNPTMAFYPHSENFLKICYLREWATPLQVGFTQAPLLPKDLKLKIN